jgi:DNA invertase Pin-like site-specific DNA recombinase
MAKTYLYVRYSNEEQKNGDSERRQVTNGTAWATANKHTITRAYYDRGVSGFQGANRAVGQFAALSNAVNSGDTILVEDLKRFGRDSALDATHDLRTLCQRGITVVLFASNRIVNKDNFDTVMLGLFLESHMGNQESVYKREKGGETWLQKRKGAANGKTVTLALPAWVSVKGDTRFLNDKSEIVERIFKLLNDGQSIKQIVRGLNLDGIKPFGRGTQNKSGHWSTTHVGRILRSKSVLGEYQPLRNTKQKDGTILKQADLPSVPDYYPKAVTPEQFWQAQERLGRHKKSGGAKSNATNLFTGIAKCAWCGSGMQLKDGSKGKRYPYMLLRCGKAFLKGDCEHRGTIQYQHVEKAVLSLIWTRIVPLLAETDNANKLDAAKAELRETDKAIGNLLDAIARTGIDDMTAGRLNDAKQRKEVLKGDIERLAAVSGNSPLADWQAVENTPENRLRLQNVLQGEIDCLTINTTDKRARLIVKGRAFDIAWDYQKANHVKKNPADNGFTVSSVDSAALLAYGPEFRALDPDLLDDAETELYKTYKVWLDDAKTLQKVLTP